jgi:NAD(P)H-dependent FMN reductase
MNSRPLFSADRKQPKVVVVSSSPSRHSRSLAGARYALAFLREHGIQAELIDLRRTPLPMYDPEAAADPGRDLLLRAFNDADAWVLAGPVYNWGSGSHLINFLHHSLGPRARRYRPFVLVAGAGSLQGLLAFDGLGRTLLHEVHGVQVGPPVLLAGAAVDPETGRLDDEVRLRLEKALTALVHFAAASAQLVEHP